jgi:hypothetical protein
MPVITPHPISAPERVLWGGSNGGNPRLSSAPTFQFADCLGYKTRREGFVAKLAETAGMDGYNSKEHTPSVGLEEKNPKTDIPEFRLQLRLHQIPGSAGSRVRGMRRSNRAILEPANHQTRFLLGCLNKEVRWQRQTRETR